MLDRPLRKFLGALSAVVLFLLSAAATAGAVGGRWDPPVFWEGVAEFFVPDPPGSPCLTAPPGAESVNGVNPCTGVVLVSVSADRSDGTNTGHLSFGGPDNTANIDKIFLDPSASQPVQGINMSAPFELSCTNTLGEFCDDESWFLQFTFTSEGDSVSNAVKLLSCLDVDFETGGCDDSGGFTTAATSRDISFTPEPGTLGLILGALGAAWSARRRKRGA